MIVLVALITLALTALPYTLGYVMAPPDMEFGGLVMNIEDSQSYLAEMLKGPKGDGSTISLSPLRSMREPS